MTGDADMVVVVLRRPERHDPTETRTDPLWEFGSFGCTRCHARNLMNPRKLHESSGRRLASRGRQFPPTATPYCQTN